MHADQLSQAGRQADLRPPVVGVYFQHQPRGRPADPPDAEKSERAGRRQPGPVRGSGSALLPCRRLRIRQDRRRRRPPADQCAKLRALQNLRHQGPDPKHRLGHARGRGRTQLSEYVSNSATAQPVRPALFFFSGQDFPPPTAENTLLLLVKTWSLRATNGLIQIKWKNFHKAFNVLSETVVLYLGEQKEYVAPN